MGLYIYICYSLKIPLEILRFFELYIFVDASEDYAVVTYFRMGGPDEINCSLVGATAKVAPLRPLKIPRIKVQSPLLGVRLSNSITVGHSINY